MDTAELMAAVNAYFNDLNAYEKYGWIAVATGFLLAVIGAILLIW